MKTCQGHLNAPEEGYLDFPFSHYWKISRISLRRKPKSKSHNKTSSKRNKMRFRQQTAEHYIVEAYINLPVIFTF